jgi:glycosyltransferase involved in cell wall biosynthesis
MSRKEPIVSMIIVTRNASQHIHNCLTSLIDQGFKNDEYEIIICDGNSDDDTIAKAKNILISKNIDYLILENENKILATGWNIAIKKARGKYVVRPDAHAVLQSGYVKTGISKLENDVNVVCVGGVLITKSDSYIGGLIAKVLSNPIGVGNSLFRVGVKKDTYSDTAVFAVYRRSIFDVCGYFDIKLERNQDIDLHKRIIRKGYKLVTSPDMIAHYFSRSNIKAFLRQAFSNGLWIVKSRQFHLRHILPLIFIVSLLLVVIMNVNLALFGLLIYAIIVEISFILKKTYDIVKLQFLMLLTFGLHISYGLGSVMGFLDRLRIKV